MFGSLYAATRQPKSLNKLILASAPAVMADWSIAAKELLRALHLRVGVEQQVLEADRKGEYMNQTYQDAMAVYNQNYLCRLRDWPEELVDVLGDPDDTVHGTMVGGGGFGLECFKTGRGIRVPTLALRGEFDEAQERVVKPWLEKIPGVKKK